VILSSSSAILWKVNLFYPPSQKTTGLPVDECANNQYATARCRPEAEADNRVVAEGEDGYFSGTTGLPVGLHSNSHKYVPFTAAFLRCPLAVPHNGSKRNIFLRTILVTLLLGLCTFVFIP
jgi:hypothetical protein